MSPINVHTKTFNATLYWFAADADRLALLGLTAANDAAPVRVVFGMHEDGEETLFVERADGDRWHATGKPLVGDDVVRTLNALEAHDATDMVFKLRGRARTLNVTVEDLERRDR